MKHRLLLSVAAALLVVAGVAAALACDHADKTAATQAKAASTSSASHEAAATTAAFRAEASGDCAAHATAARAKSGSFSCAGHAAGHVGCPAMEGAAAATAARSGCPAFSSTGSEHVCSADQKMTAGESAGCCMGIPSKARSASASAPSGGAMAMTAGSACSGNQMTTADGQKCDWCTNMAMCDEELRQIGVETQVVPLKNGVMVLYTATSPHGVEAVQAAVARRGERLAAIVAAGDKAHLCSKCKEMRGAMASGKLQRETVNIEGGCLTVMTSDDPKVVTQIQSMSGIGSNGRSKT